MPANNSQNPLIQITDPQTLEKLKGIYNDIVIEDSVKNAFEFSRGIEKKLAELKLEEKDKELYKKYKDIAVKLKWIALPWLRDEEIAELFKNHFTLVFEIEFFDVWQKLKTKLLDIMLLEDRDKLKEKIQQALLLNQEKLTNQTLINNQPPTISNWLKDYTSKLGTNPIDTAKQTEYLISSENIKGLKEPERNKLVVLFNIFERSKLSSTTAQGLEDSVIVIDDQGNEGEITEGRLIRFKDEKEITSDLKKMAEIIYGPEFIKDLEAQVPEPPSTPIPTDYQSLVQQILTQANLTLPDENLKARFQNIILSRLRNVRTQITTKETLSRPVKVGGLGLSPDQAEKVSRLIEAEAQKIHVQKVDKEKPPTGIEKLIASEVTPVSFLRKTPVPTTPTSLPGQALLGSPKPEPAQKKLEPPAKLPIAEKDQEKPAEEPRLSRPQPLKPTPIEPSVRPPLVKPPQPKPTLVDIKKPSPPIPPFSSLPRAASRGRPLLPSTPSPTRPPVKAAQPQMEGLAPPPRLVGGVEEVAALRLADFRRWSPEPAEAAARIREKIDALEQESFTKKAQAISAWQKSEINKLYLDIGRQSMETGDPIAAVIKKRQIQHQPVLNLDEFNAIADLNRELNY